MASSAVLLLSALNLRGPLYPPERIVKNNSCFDFIIVGGGTAGCALGGRLSENPYNSVLILEAGEDPPITSLSPALFASFAGSKYDANYTSTFDSYAASSQYNYTKLSSGIALGGSSSINHLIEYRGSAHDVDEWAQITNDGSWSYENVLRYYKKKERLEDPEILASKYREVHGLKGPNAITRQPRKELDNLLKALNETGSKTPLDVTGKVSVGVAQTLFTLNSKGIRQSTALTYLTPARERKNLFVNRKTTVIRIIFEGEKAVGVVAVKTGKVYVYRACKEVIICGGAFGSPKLLMLSGIGPKEHLESLNIQVKTNLPVGKNFRNQVSTFLVHRLETNKKPPPSGTNLFQFPFPILTGEAALDPDQPYADYLMFMLLFAGGTSVQNETCAVVLQYRRDLCDRFAEANAFHNTLFTLLPLLQPHSAGNIRLRSDNPFDRPLIETGYYKNTTDIYNMVKYIKHYLKIENSTYFKEVGAKLINPNLEECSKYPFRTDDYWKCHLLHTAGNVYHDTGSCAMGSVVDGKLRVYNIKNLRVVDASVMPKPPTGCPYSNVLMIAEKAADMIKADADKKGNCSKERTVKKTKTLP